MEALEGAGAYSDRQKSREWDELKLRPGFGSELGTHEASLPNPCLWVLPKDPSFEDFWRSHQMESLVRNCCQSELGPLHGRAIQRGKVAYGGHISEF